MKYSSHMSAYLHRLRMLPHSWLSLSRSHRVLLVALSYGLGVAGLWLLFPPTHNAASMFLPIVSACWLFHYRGLLISLILNGVAFQLTYVLLLRGILPDQAFVEGGIIGFVTSLALGLVICWLRAAVDGAHAARQQALAGEQERLLIFLKEREATLAYEQERKINALKDQFLLNVGHELRTPLTVLGGSLELLADFDERLNPIKQARLLKDARASQEELANLADRLLEAITVVSDIPQAQLEVVCIHQLIQEVLAHLAPEDVAAYTICLHVPEQVMVWADPQFLRQVLRNLLTNIFKYVPTQTEIRIETTQAGPFSPVCLSIQDAGPGIPAEELPLLFEKFVRLKRDLAGPTSGTGLGLYICKRLVQAMGGRIWVEPADYKDGGSRFCLTLPLFSSLPAIEIGQIHHAPPDS